MYVVRDLYPDHIKNSQNSVIAFRFGVCSSNMVVKISKNRTFVVDGFFRIKLNEFLTQAG